MSLSLKRGRELEIGGVGLSQDDLPAMSQEGAQGQGALDPRAWFAREARDHPLDLEIGSGKGTFLVQQAKLFPEVNYLGIEWARAFWLHAADRVRRHDLHHIRVLRTDAAAFIRHHATAGCFRQAHIYFPDPWPKSRHHKRRLIQADFLRALHRTLAPLNADDADAGQVRIATDHEDYFQWMQEHAAQVTDLFEVLPFDPPASAGEGELAGTNFERKYRKEGRAFHGMTLRRRT